MDALVQSLHTGVNSDPVVRSAMAHLNLVMIHPFRDGNGRMARALATLVLTRSDIGEPEFSSIEEWLGANTEDYYSVLAHTGHGSWQPARRRAPLADVQPPRPPHAGPDGSAPRRRGRGDLERSRPAPHGTRPSRPHDGGDVRRRSRLPRAPGGYIKRAEVTEQTATRDLAALTSAGILTATVTAEAATTPPPSPAAD